MSTSTSSKRYDDVQVGDELAPLPLPLTRTFIVAAAIASRDYQDVHHDAELAQQKGSQDIFMNILSDTAYCSRFLTDWAGPEAMLRRLSIRLGVPTFPGSTLRYTGTVTATSIVGDHGVVEIALQAVNALGDHVSGTAELRLPRRP